MSIFDKVKSVFSSDSGDKTNDNSKEQENLTSVQIFANILDSFPIEYKTEKMDEKDGSIF